MATTKWTASQMSPQTGKVMLVTGANSGVGFQASLELARHGAHVLLGVRNPAKGRAALERIGREAAGASVEVVELDVASLTSVRSFAEAFLRRKQRLDVLMNNAGVMGLPTRELTADGFERQFATNHLGHFALTGLLLPALEKSAAGRVVTVASLAHRNGAIEADNLQSERSYDPMGAYNNSKLANLLFAYELDRRLKASKSSILSIAAHPGVAKTNVFVNGPGDSGGFKMRVMQAAVSLLAQDDVMGALPLEYAATAPDVKTGQYVGPDGFSEIKGYPKVVQPRARALDESAARTLWTASEHLTGVIYRIAQV
jgi:NAD(P)-dependent dehydrogenase (short-subunit alcohol dehydrogenase family)